MFPARPVDVNEKGVRMSTIEIARAIGSALLPPVCCLCGAPGQAPALDLCDVCATFLPVLDDLPRPGWEPEDVLGSGTLLRTLFLFKYQYPVDHFIRALKFRGERVYARVLGELMARARLDRSGAMPTCIVPVPLHRARFRERGFNQAYEIARYAGAALGVRVAACVLGRRVATREQSGLSVEERRRNVRGVFEVVGEVPRGTIALLDDVVTTGNTAMAAAEMLLLAGAEEVELWAVARVEKDSFGLRDF
jgi:ComF family protein